MTGNPELDRLIEKLDAAADTGDEEEVVEIVQAIYDLLYEPAEDPLAGSTLQ
jgi:hypothetical protein